MRRLLMSLAAAAVVGAPGLAQAGVFTDDMSKCLVRSSNDNDQKDLMLWIFSAMSAHPEVAIYVSMTPAQRDVITHKGGKLMQRLLTVDCRKETVAALKYDGTGAIEQAFGVLGRVAVQGLMSHEAVSKNMDALAEAVDVEQLAALFKEAGIVESGAKE